MEKKSQLSPGQVFLPADGPKVEIGVPGENGFFPLIGSSCFSPSHQPPSGEMDLKSQFEN